MVKWCGNFTNGIGVLDFLLGKISQNELTEIDTYTGSGYVPAGPIRSTGVSVSTDRNILKRFQKVLKGWSRMITGV